MGRLQNKLTVSILSVFLLHFGLLISSSFADDSVITVNPTRLIEEFRENALALERKYAGKQIEISGVTTVINKDATGQPIVKLVDTINHLALNNQFGVVYFPPMSQEITCQFREDQVDELVTLKRSQQIVALCDELKITNKSILLTGCKFIKHL